MRVDIHVDIETIKCPQNQRPIDKTDALPTQTNIEEDEGGDFRVEFSNFTNITQMLSTALNGNLDDRLRELVSDLEVTKADSVVYKPHQNVSQESKKVGAKHDVTPSSGLFASVMARVSH